MSPDFVRLPSRCNNCANVVKIDGVCYKCDKKYKYKKKTICRECGCILELKLPLIAEKCPIGK